MNALKPQWVIAAGVISAACTPASASSTPTERAVQPAQGRPSEAPLQLLADPPLQRGGNLLLNATFDSEDTFPWLPSFTSPAQGDVRVQDGRLCVDVTNAGLHEWDAQLRHRNLAIHKGHTYWIRFAASSSVPTTVRAKVGASGPPYEAYWTGQADLSAAQPRTFGAGFAMGSADDASAELVFQFGGPLAKSHAPSRICLDDVHLEDPEYVPAVIETRQLPKLRVNGVGWTPASPKRAMIVSASRAPLEWQLVGPGGSVVASGQTTVRGPDAASGDPLHVIDFSRYSTPARGLLLKVASDASEPFDVDEHVYRPLKYDALAFFYQMRSGIPIEMPYAREPKWTRPAGHPGDANVPCAPDAGCNYSLDVHGGWYDAGDHGKYVVNGAFSAWLLLDEYERATNLGRSADSFGDGTMNIPESHNRIPDLLDEAKWELSFLLRMQVPEGRPLAGMVHHKVHDRKWTPIPTAPDKDPEPRFLHAPSTGATLALAAVGAQCARIYKQSDPAFAASCLSGAERAWAAAAKYPDRMAPVSDNVGGGSYDDNDLSDEFYWAAAELFLTTAKPAYHDSMARSKHYLEIPAPSGQAFSWQLTQALGTISLALVPGRASAGELAGARKSIISSADSFLRTIQDQGYRIPLTVYFWGSNSIVLDNAVILALAYDFTKDSKYLSGVVDSMDYILGRNTHATSFVTGYGKRAAEHPHHRFWAHEANASFPPAPPGSLVGGPNADVQDPKAKSAGLQNRPPAKCWLDDIESWSTNEVAINWNAALAWVSAFLDQPATP